jgi:hypothetical protein
MTVSAETGSDAGSMRVPFSSDRIVCRDARHQSRRRNVMNFEIHLPMKLDSLVLLGHIPEKQQLYQLLGKNRQNF